MVQLSSMVEPLRSLTEGPEFVSFSLETPEAALPNGRRSRLARRSTAWGTFGTQPRTSRSEDNVVNNRTTLANISRSQHLIGLVITVMAAAVVPRVFLKVPGKSAVDPYTQTAGLVVSAASAVVTQALARDGYTLRVALFACANFCLIWTIILKNIAIFFGYVKLGTIISYPFYIASIALRMRLTRDSVTDVSTAIGSPMAGPLALVSLIRTFYLSCGVFVITIFVKAVLGDKFVYLRMCYGIAAWICLISLVGWLVMAILVLRSGCALAFEATAGLSGRQADECTLAAKTIVLEIIGSSITVGLDIAQGVIELIEKGYMWPLPSLAENTFIGQNWYACLVMCNATGNALCALYLCGFITGSARAAQLRLEKEEARHQMWLKASSEIVNVPTSPWEEKVEELSSRGFSLAALLDFYRGLGRSYMDHFQADQHRTVDVVRHAVIPLSASSKSALACVMMKGKPTKPQKMVTHNWGNLFRDLVAAIIADALDEEEYNRISDLLQAGDVDQLEEWCRAAGKLHTTYWVCAFSVNQHCTVCGQSRRGCCDSVTGEPYPLCECGVAKVWNTSQPTNDEGQSIQCEVNKFDDMMKLLSGSDQNFEQVVAIDHEFDLFTRSWCVAELAAASEMGMRQRLKFSSEARLTDKEDELRKLKIQDMQASRPEDTAFILSKIQDVRAFNAELQRLLFKDLLPSWGDLDAVEQIHRLARIARWQHLERKRSMSNQSSSIRSMMNFLGPVARLRPRPARVEHQHA